MKSKILAFVIHLAISTAVALLAMLLVFKVWYPAPLDNMMGIKRIFYLLVSVDVILGPILTFIIFKPAKPSLRFDLTVIALLQISALGYGLWTVQQGRPVWIVFNVDRFDVVRVLDLDMSRRQNTPVEYRRYSWFGPEWVYAESPDDIEERNRLTLESVFAGIDLPQRPDLYQPLENARTKLQQRAIPLEMLTQYNSADDVERLKQRWPDADAYIPLVYGVRFATVLVNTDSAKVVGISPLLPW